MRKKLHSEARREALGRINARKVERGVVSSTFLTYSFVQIQFKANQPMTGTDIEYAGELSL